MALAFRLAMAIDAATIGTKPRWRASDADREISGDQARADGSSAEAMECHGGAGYVEESALPRLFRQSPLNAIWEGSGNVIALDMVRALAREPASVEALRGFLHAMRGRIAAYDSWIDEIDFGSAGEAGARLFVERLALAAQAAVLLSWDNPMAEAFCQLRLLERGAAYGAFDLEIDARAIIERAAPVA